jgi:hypothetical protein
MRLRDLDRHVKFPFKPAAQCLENSSTPRRKFPEMPVDASTRFATFPALLRGLK